jgi:hypothetical protein
VGTNAKLRIAAGVVLVLGLLAVITGNALPGIVLILLGAGGIVYVMRQPDDDEDGGGTTKKKAKNAKSKLDSAIEAKKSTGQAPTAPRTGGGLPTWNPTALDTWSPPSLSERDAVEEEPASSSEWDSWGSWENDDAGDDTDTITLDDDNPLDALDSLDDIDPIAEVERLDSLDAESYDPLGSLDTAEELDDFEFEDDFDESLLSEDEPVVEKSSGGGFSFSSAPAVINEEEIKTADDIMAASHATELELPVADGGDSELARLLAKVQARLSAYE